MKTTTKKAGPKILQKELRDEIMRGEEVVGALEEKQEERDEQLFLSLLHVARTTAAGSTC